MMLIYCEDLGKHFIIPELCEDFSKQYSYGPLNILEDDLDDVHNFDGNGYRLEENAIRFGIFLIYFYEMVDWF